MAHHSTFPANWWSEHRRKRDYYVDDDGEVQLRMGSPTAQALFGALTKDAERIAAELSDSEPRTVN